MKDCIVKGPFNEKTIYGIPAFNIATMIIFSGIVAKYFGVHTALITVPVAFVLYKVFCINTLFFSSQKTGVVSEVWNRVRT